MSSRFAKRQTGNARLLKEHGEEIQYVLRGCDPVTITHALVGRLRKMEFPTNNGYRLEKGRRIKFQISEDNVLASGLEGAKQTGDLVVRGERMKIETIEISSSGWVICEVIRIGQLDRTSHNSRRPRG